MRVGIVLTADEERGDDRGEDPDRGDHEREKRAGVREGLVQARVHRHAECERRDDRADIGLEKVGAHAGHVADIVTDVIGDDGGVARVILGNTDLDLADEVSADVGSLGIDAAADAREKGDRRGAEREAEHRADVAGDIDEAAAEQTETHDAHAHDRAAGEGDRQGLVHAAFHGGVCRADVRAGGHSHAEETGGDRKQRAEQKTDGRSDVDEDRDQREEDDDEDRKDPVFRHQKGVGALGDGGSDLPHPFVAGGSLGDIDRLVGGKQQGYHGEDRRKPYHAFHINTPLKKTEKENQVPFLW